MTAHPPARSVWIDYSRPAPDGFVWARSLVEARAILSASPPGLISISGECVHDVAPQLEVLAYEGFCGMPPRRCVFTVHDPTAEALAYMRRIVDSIFTYWAADEQPESLCDLCGLSETRQTIVWGEGDCSSSGLMFVGEAPGYDEDLRGRPFQGMAGRTLRQLLVMCGIEPYEARISNIVKCRPPENRKPARSEIAACSDHLAREIALHAPRALVAVGLSASHSLTGAKVPLSDMVGNVYHYLGVPVVPTYHTSPLCVNRNPETLAKITEAIKKAASIAGARRPWRISD